MLHFVFACDLNDLNRRNLAKFESEKSRLPPQRAAPPPAMRPRPFVPRTHLVLNC